MSKLDEILKEFRHTCFLVKDMNLNDDAVNLMASQIIVTKNEIKKLLVDSAKEKADQL